MTFTAPVQEKEKGALGHGTVPPARVYVSPVAAAASRAKRPGKEDRRLSMA